MDGQDPGQNFTYLSASAYEIKAQLLIPMDSKALPLGIPLPFTLPCLGKDRHASCPQCCHLSLPRLSNSRVLPEMPMWSGPHPCLRPSMAPNCPQDKAHILQPSLSGLFSCGSGLPPSSLHLPSLFAPLLTTFHS